MAAVRTIDNKLTTISHEQALAIWNILEGKTEPANQQQADFCLKVKAVYFNTSNKDVPEKYLKKLKTKQ